MKCILCWIIGAALIVGGVIVEATWLGFCFGTVVIGILLLILSPGILFAPFLFGVSAGMAIIVTGCEDK